MGITIDSSCKVLPSESTPNGRLELSESDQRMGWTHAPTIYIFKPNSKTSYHEFDSLRISLSNILVPYYPLAGRLHWIGGSRLELDCCAAGAVFIQAHSDAKLEDFDDFKPNEQVRELVPKVDYTKPIEELPVLLVQLTRFSCGGLCIGAAISHILVDGISAIRFINSWASIARGDESKDSILQPFHDRTILQPQKPVKPPRFDHREYYKPPLLKGRDDPLEEKKKETEVTLLKVSKEQIEKLKSKANDGVELLVKKAYSRFESIAGHIWVCMCKARDTGDNSQNTCARIPVDIRRRLTPSLPEEYFGNAVLVTISTCEFGDLISNPLSYAAGKIREAILKVSTEYARSALDFMAKEEDMGWIRASYHTLGCTEAPFWGNPNLSLGCWLTMPVYDADFGWGKPIYMGPAALNADGKLFMMPDPAGDGSVIIALRLQRRHMGDFKKFFYKDL